MTNRLYVSYRDLRLDNLPPGRLERRVIDACDAIDLGHEPRGWQAWRDSPTTGQQKSPQE